jgi:hypothetical protein
MGAPAAAIALGGLGDEPTATVADPRFSTAFSLGWETASLFHGASFDPQAAAGPVAAPDADALPGLTGLDAGERTGLAIDLIETKLRKLSSQLGAEGLGESEQLQGLRLVAGMESTSAESLREAVRSLHVHALAKLTAAELRLGRAYGLGHALAETCLLPTDRASFDRAFGARLVCVKDWLADLASSFPPHSSRAVVVSLRAWEEWAAEPRVDDEPLAWARHGAGVRDALRRQGELWRDLLACDKDGRDMLDTDHYIGAARALVVMMASKVWRFMRPVWAPFAIATLVLTAGIALLALAGAAGQVVGAVLTAAGALGITGAGLRARLGGIAGQLQKRLWGAELDLAIARAVLIGPAGWDGGIEGATVPATGVAPKVALNLAALGDFRRAVEGRRPKTIAEHIAADAEFSPAEGPLLRGHEDIVDWILNGGGARISPEPRSLEAVGPGFLVAHRADGADLWRIQEGKVRRWQSCEDAEKARAAARNGGP